MYFNILISSIYQVYVYCTRCTLYWIVNWTKSKLKIVCFLIIFFSLFFSCMCVYHSVAHFAISVESCLKDKHDWMAYNSFKLIFFYKHLFKQNIFFRENWKLSTTGMKTKKFNVPSNTSNHNCRNSNAKRCRKIAKKWKEQFVSYCMKLCATRVHYYYLYVCISFRSWISHNFY